MRLAFVNTRMPGINTFQIRDLRWLLREGVVYDLYLFDDRDLDPDFRRAIEAAGGTVQRIPFPGTPRTFAVALREIVRRPARGAGSAAIALGTMAASLREGFRALAVLPASIELSDRISRSGAGHVHALWAGVPATVAYWVHRHAGVRWSFSAHAWDLLASTRMLPRKARSAAGVVICSEWGRGVLETRLGPRSIAHIAVVHHGLDLDEWAYIPREKRNEPPVIVAVGRLTPKKGFDHLIDACRLLRDRGLDFRCEIIGPDGGLGASLDRAIIAFSLEACVRLLGATPPAETRSRIAGADLLACPSIRTDSGSSDGIPNVVLEAMALGTPVVATDAGGIPEVVLPGETGYRVPQRDPGALAAALAAALADEPGRRRMAAAARARVESAFDVRRTTRDFLGAIGVERPAESKPALRETATG